MSDLMSGHAGPAPTEGQTPRYKILGRIASGGMGAVYLGTRTGDAAPARLVAIKVIHQHLAENRVFVDMLIDEAHVASKIHHPNVVGIIDVGAFGSRQFVVMPYIEGGTLSELVRRETRHLPIALVAHVLGEALDGLHAAHSLVDDQGQSLGLVHRDVSPGNILIGTDGITRVIDFGVAKAATRITQTAPGTVKGKFSYMAPEQAMGEQIDCRADVFAVGVVLWTVLTGKGLFTGKNSADTIRNLMSADIAPPSQVRPKIPRAFDEVCLRALHRSPHKRYQSAAEMAAALRQAALSAGRQIAPSVVGKLVSEAFADRIQQRRKILEEVRRTSRSFTVDQPGFELQVADLDDRQPVDSLTPATPSARVQTSAAAVMGPLRVDTGSISAPDARLREALSNTPGMGSSLDDLHTGVTEALTIAVPMRRTTSGGLIPLSREQVVARTPRPRRHGKYVVLAVALACVGLGVMLRDQLRGLLAGASPAPEVAPTLIEPVRIAVDPPAAPVARAAAPDAMAVAEHDPAAPAPGAPDELPDALPGQLPDALPGQLPGALPDAPPGQLPDEPADGAAGAVEAVPAAVEPATETDEPSPTGAGSSDSVSPSDKPDRPRKRRRREPRSRPERPTLDIGKSQ
jgi:serine/threonine-protein kinase